MVPINYQALRQELVQLIKIHKKIDASRLLSQNFDQVGFDTIDIVDIILEIEKTYHIHIPDEVPLNKVDDFVRFLSSQNLETNA